MKKVICLMVSLCILISMIQVGEVTVQAGNTTVAALQAKFPNGKYWNSGNPNTYTSAACTHHTPSNVANCSIYGTCGCTYYNGIQCNGFARKVTDEYYGSQFKTWSTSSSINSIKAGDVFYTGNHYAWVIARNGNTLTLGECNWYGACKISWGRALSISGLPSGTIVYVAPYEINDNIVVPATPTITSCSVSGSSITVSWNAVDAATNYSVDFCKVAGDTYNHSYTSTTATTMTKTLEDGLYAVRVEAGNSAGSSGFTSFKYLWVSNNNVPISPEITEVYVDGNNVTVLWDWVDYTNEFSVEFYSTINDSSEFFKVSDNSCTTRLETGRYGVRVFGVNTAGAKSKETDFTYFDLGAVSVKFDACGGSLDNAPKASYAVSSVNGQRGEDQLVIFTGSGTTGTNIYGGEALVDANNKVAEIIREVGNATIPTNGMILSGHRAAYYWIVENIEIGDYVYFDDAANMVYIYTEDAYMVNNKTAIYGGAYGELPVPEKDGYIFKGWFTEPTGGREITSSTVASVSEEHVLYAQWEAEEEYIDATVGVKNDTYRITVNNNLKNGKIIVAGYNGDVLVSVKSHAAAEEDIATVFEGNKIDVVKVLAWEGLPSLKPAMMQEIAKDEFLDASKEVWVLKSELPEGKEIINTKYTYVLTSYAESEESEMEGWDCYSSKWVITGGGDFKYASFPSGFDTNSVYYQTMQTQAKTAYETENTKRVIETTPGGYIYWHWCRNSYTSGPINRWVEDAYKSTSMGNFFTFHAFEDTADVTESDGESCYKYSNANCCKDSYWYYKLPCSICYYTDYSKVFMFKKVQEFETEAYPEGENISNVQEWVCYVE